MATDGARSIISKCLLYNGVFGQTRTKLEQRGGGWGGIRTHEELAPPPVFKTGAFNRSATHPSQLVQYVTIQLQLNKSETLAPVDPSWTQCG
jgi:hypothetical protein